MNIALDFKSALTDTITSGMAVLKGSLIGIALATLVQPNYNDKNSS